MKPWQIHAGLALFSLAALTAWAAYPATPYAPNETLDPSCTPGDANCFVQSPYLTGETDPLFKAAPAYGVLSGDLMNWNAAFSWGDHASMGYLTGSAIVSLNGLKNASQFLLAGSSGSDFAIVSNGNSHIFNIPISSATSTGLLSGANRTTFNNKLNYASLSSTGGVSYDAVNGVFGDNFSFTGGLSRTGNTLRVQTITGSQISGFTAGQIPFGNDQGGFSQSGGLFWDNTNGKFLVVSNSTNGAISAVGSTVQKNRVGNDGNDGVWLRTSDGIRRLAIYSTSVYSTFQAENGARLDFQITGDLTKNINFLSNNGTYMAMTVKNSNGNIGIGTTSPSAKLEVAGSIKIGDGGETCNAAGEGYIRYNTGSHVHEGCNGTAWKALY